MCVYMYTHPSYMYTHPSYMYTHTYVYTPAGKHAIAAEHHARGARTLV